MVKRKKKNWLKWPLISLVFLVGVIIVLKVYNQRIFSYSQHHLTPEDRTWLNYKDEVIEELNDSTISPAYILALITLECSGELNIKSRFESHVFNKLEKVRNGEVPNFEQIYTADIANSSDDALKNLASSWGPFQLMGYQCFYLGIKLKEMRGKRAVKHGITWIKNAYGEYLAQKRYKDAFHLHNTGKPFPKHGRSKTHDPRYVIRGLKYMAHFDSRLKSEP